MKKNKNEFQELLQQTNEVSNLGDSKKIVKQWARNEQLVLEKEAQSYSLGINETMLKQVVEVQNLGSSKNKIKQWAREEQISIEQELITMQNHKTKKQNLFTSFFSNMSKTVRWISAVSMVLIIGFISIWASGILNNSGGGNPNNKGYLKGDVDSRPIDHNYLWSLDTILLPNEYLLWETAPGDYWIEGGYYEEITKGQEKLILGYFINNIFVMTSDFKIDDYNTEQTFFIDYRVRLNEKYLFENYTLYENMPLFYMFNGVSVYANVNQTSKRVHIKFTINKIDYFIFMSNFDDGLLTIDVNAVTLFLQDLLTQI